MQPDALQILAGAVEVRSLMAVGAIPGVAPLLAGGGNGPGMGRLSSSGNGRLTWQAPGSSKPGSPVVVSAGGQFALGDGVDPQRWLRVGVYAAYLEPAAAEAAVQLGDVFDNAVGGPDVTAAQAAAGDVQTVTLTLSNAGSSGLSQLRAWIDPACTGLTISADGSTFSAPTTEGTALLLPDLEAGGSMAFYLRRTISPGAQSAASVLNLLNFSYSSVGS
jgi:hypothetical protein